MKLILFSLSSAANVTDPFAAIKEKTLQMCSLSSKSLHLDISFNSSNCMNLYYDRSLELRSLSLITSISVKKYTITGLRSIL